MRHLANPFQVTYPPLRQRVEELCAFLKNAFGMGRTTHHAAHALPIHSLDALLSICYTSP
jgi:hypothetical protein